MRTIPNGHLFGPAESATNSLNSIGDNRFTITRTPEHYAPLEFSLGHGLSNGADKIGIITRRFGGCAKIPYGMPLGEKHSLNFFLVREAGMVGSDGDGEFLHSALIK